MSNKKELKFSDVFDCELKVGKFVEVIDDAEELVYEGKIINTFSCFGDTVDEIEVEDECGQKRRYNGRMKYVRFYNI